jgi:hypothetical protein
VEIEIMRPNEEEHEEDLQRLLQRAYPVPAPPEQFAGSLQEQLIAMLPAATQLPAPARPRNRITHWIGGFTMRQRIAALGSLGVAAVLVFLLLWAGIDTKPVSAMEKMAENIRKAKSYKYNMIVRITYENPEPGRPRVSEYEHIIYRLASGEARTEDIRKPRKFVS